MSYDNIERVSNEIFKPCYNFVLRHNVKVSSKNSNTGAREYFHSEYTYLSNNYSDVKYLKSMKLKYSSYLTLEETGKDWTEKESLMITQHQIHMVVNLLKKVKKWFYKKKYDKLYFYDKDGHLNISMEFKSLRESVTLVGNKTLVFEPTIVIIDDDEYEGVNMYINKSTSIGKVTIDNFEAMYRILKRFDLYLAGTELINYLQRPEFDKFNMDIGNHSFTNKTSFVESKGFNTSVDKNEDMMKGFFK